MKRAGELIRNRRGAVLAEAAVAMFPLLSMFFCFSQFGKMAVARQVMQHATTVAARYAMVAYPSCIPRVGSGPDSDLAQAATSALGPWKDSITVTSVSVSYGGGDPFGDMSVQATFNYQCNVPLGKLICGGGFSPNIPAVTVPHSGARYNHACQ